jgi:cytochrome P450
MILDVAAGSWLVDYLPFLDYLPEKFAPWREKARQFHTYDMGFWNVFYQRIQQRSLEGTAPDCFITRLLEEKEKSKISDGDAAGLMASLLNAGTDTTAASLQCFFKAICVDDRFARIAQAELDSVVGRDRLPGWEDQPNLPYIQAIVKELHRWSSISPLAFQHATSGNDKFRGRDIPKGTIITPNTYAVHHNPDIFEDHETFLPERYLRASDPRSIPNASKIENHYAFGIGRRVCPGQLVANASLYISVSRLLWAFKIGKKPGVEMNDNISKDIS